MRKVLWTAYPQFPRLGARHQSDRLGPQAQRVSLLIETSYSGGQIFRKAAPSKLCQPRARRFAANAGAKLRKAFRKVILGLVSARRARSKDEADDLDQRAD